MIDKNAKMYVAGQNGLVGLAILRRLKAHDYKNLITVTHRDMNLVEREKVEKIFAKEKPEYVFVADAKVGGIHANSTYPAEFIYENLMIQTNVIDLSYRYGVKKLLLLASSCIYPKMCRQPMKEDYLLTGSLDLTSESFAIAKIAGIKMCEAYNRQYGTNFISIIPANVYGINDHFDEDGHVVASLIRRFHEAKTAGHKKVTIWGTGRPKREFLYVDDLADACIFLIDRYDKSGVINVGTGYSTSIAELAGLIKRVVGFDGEIDYDTTRPDGNPERLLDTSKITALGRRFKMPLEKGLKITYEWYKKHIKR